MTMSFRMKSHPDPFYLSMNETFLEENYVRYKLEEKGSGSTVEYRDSATLVLPEYRKTS